MKARRTKTFLVVALTTLLAGRSHGQEAKPPAGKPDGEKTGSTVEVTSGPFRIEVELKGVLEPDRVETIRVDPQEWTTLKVSEIAKQGARVKAGDVVVAFETDELDEQLAKLEFALRLAKLTREQTARELDVLEKSAPLDVQIAERSRDESREDMEYFLQTDKAISEEQTERSVENSQFQLEYALEELEQLQKMYRADDLTEETEEIILKRTERSVENAKYYLRLAQIRSERVLETELPRKEAAVRNAALSAELAYRRAAATVPLLVDRKETELAKQRFEYDLQEKKYRGLEADRKLLVVRAPVDGVVYHGTWRDGVWSIPSSLKPQLKVGGTLPARQPILSIVGTKPRSIRTTVDEKDVARLAAGVDGVAVPSAYPRTKLDCQVREVSPFPVEPGKFGVTISVDTDDAPRLVPGMNCTVELVVHDERNAITVPSKAVFDEDGKDVVYVVEGDDVERRTVDVGHAHDGRTEILAGLEVGDRVRTSKP